MPALKRARCDIGDDLVTVVQQLDQFGAYRIGQRRRTRPPDFAELPDRLGVDPIGLGPQALRASKLPDLLGIDDRGRHAGFDQNTVQTALAAARRLQDDHGVTVIPTACDQKRRNRGVAFRSVGQAPAALTRQAVEIKIIA